MKQSRHTFKTSLCFVSHTVANPQKRNNSSVNKLTHTDACKQEMGPKKLGHQCLCNIISRIKRTKKGICGMDGKSAYVDNSHCQMKKVWEIAERTEIRSLFFSLTHWNELLFCSSYFDEREGERKRRKNHFLLFAFSLSECVMVELFGTCSNRTRSKMSWRILWRLYQVVRTRLKRGKGTIERNSGRERCEKPWQEPGTGKKRDW